MGLLVDGRWVDRWYATDATSGRFVRRTSRFRDRIVRGSGDHPPAAGRYHLYVSRACPWAHRTLIMRAFKGLQEVVDVSVVNPEMLEDGWFFDDEYPDRLHGSTFLHEIYTRARPGYTGRVTVPVLWDSMAGRIVNNESSEIIAMFNSEFAGLGQPHPLAAHEFEPAGLAGELEAVNNRVYEAVNDGVYKCGFATSQQAYEEAFDSLFETLDWLEERLGRQRYLLGGQPSTADLRLFTTLVRFDLVCFGHFKCNLRPLTSYWNLWNWTRAFYQLPGVAGTCNFAEMKRHYYYSHGVINPTRIVPRGPRLDWEAPHDRDRLGPAW